MLNRNMNVGSSQVASYGPPADIRFSFPQAQLNYIMPNQLQQANLSRTVARNPNFQNIQQVKPQMLLSAKRHYEPRLNQIDEAVQMSVANSDSMVQALALYSMIGRKTVVQETRDSNNEPQKVPLYPQASASLCQRYRTIIISPQNQQTPDCVDDLLDMTKQYYSIDGSDWLYKMRSIFRKEWQFVPNQSMSTLGLHSYSLWCFFWVPITVLILVCIISGGQASFTLKATLLNLGTQIVTAATFYIYSRISVPLLQELIPHVEFSSYIGTFQVPMILLLGSLPFWLAVSLGVIGSAMLVYFQLTNYTRVSRPNLLQLITMTLIALVIRACNFTCYACLFNSNSTSLVSQQTPSATHYYAFKHRTK